MAAKPSSHSPEWERTANEAVRDRGGRSGGARRAVISALAAEDCCLSAQEVADELRRRGETIGIASIYRALDLLHGLGLLQRVDTGDGTSRYEAVAPDGEHHHHVVCEACGAVTPFQDDALEAAIDGVAGRLDHAVTAHDVVIRGTCPRCARARRS